MKKENFLQSDIFCPLCQSRKNKYNKVCKEYKIFKCKNCDAFFSYPMKAMEYENKELAQKDFDSVVKRSLRRNFVYCLVVSFLKEIGGKNILDIGAGQGIFLSYAKKLGYKTYGTEVSQETIDVLKNNCPFTETFKSDNLEYFPENWPQKYDVISCLDVIEHVENPVLVAERIKNKLDKNGFLIISVPNRNRYYYKFLGLVDDFVPKEHGGDNPPYHLTFWTKKSSENFLKKIGFNNFQIIKGGLFWRKNIYIKGKYSYVLSELLKIFYRVCPFLPMFVINIFESWGTHLIIFAKKEEDRGEFKNIIKKVIKKTYKKQIPFFVEGDIE